VAVLAIIGLPRTFYLGCVLPASARNTSNRRPIAVAPEKLPEDLASKATGFKEAAVLPGRIPRQRAKTLLQLPARWTTKAGVVRLPVARAMELIVQENGVRK